RRSSASATPPRGIANERAPARRPAGAPPGRMTRIPTMPPLAPRDGNRFSRWFGRSILRAGGWTIRGDWPDVPRLVVIAAPHSSGWDAFWGLAAKLAMGVDIAFIAKAELFRGPLGWLLRLLGGR